jgi:hypothetical protein
MMFLQIFPRPGLPLRSIPAAAAPHSVAPRRRAGGRVRNLSE